MDDQIIGISAEDIDYIDSVLSSGERLYRAYDRALTYLEPGTDRHFWFEQASIINQQANGIEAGFDGANTNGHYDYSDKMLTAIAYSAIDEGTLVFGDTGIRAICCQL